VSSHFKTLTDPVRRGWRQVNGAIWGAVWSTIRSRWGEGSEVPGFHTIVRGGTIYDGSGGPSFVADVGIARGRVAAIGDLSRALARDEIDARGLAVAPGFINPLSWATESLLADPSAESDIRQGVTLEIFGEGLSMGPLSPDMKRDLAAKRRDYPVEIDWTTLGEFFDHMERRGFTPNIASFVGATTVRKHLLGHERRAPTPLELKRMCELVREAMRDGALGLGSALIYSPAAFAATEELRQLALAAAEFGGAYATHLRSESDRLLEALSEALSIARATRRHVEIYHLKAAGRANWPLMAKAIEMIDAARAAGLSVAANMYPYDTAASGLDAAMPLWCQEGGHHAWLERLRQPDLRSRIAQEIRAAGTDWENLYAAAGSADLVRVLGLRNPELQRYTGWTLAAIARERGVTPEVAMIDLVLADDSRVAAAFTLMSEANIEAQLTRPWVSICSDEEALAPRPPFLTHHPHPRGYGAFARFLGRYVRERQLLPLAEAIRRLTSLPADNFSLADRGRLAPDYWADVVVFDPQSVVDRATFAAPHQFSRGVAHVLINGVAVLRDGALTGARPGRIVRGPGWRRSAEELPRAAG
jgi:N-acyl-D-amino-acid deacylase